MNKTMIINLIISLLTVVKAINETIVNKDSEEITEKNVESVTIESSYGKGLSNVVNKYDFLSTKKLISKHNPSKAFFVKIRQLENDKPLQKSPESRSKISESLVSDMIDPPPEERVKTISNETERINEDTTELSLNVNIRERENKTEGIGKDKAEVNKGYPLEDDVKHKSVTNKSVVDEDSKIMIFHDDDDDDEILPPDDKALDDIRFSRRMMSSQYSEDQKDRQDWGDDVNSQKWREVKNDQDWEDYKSALFLEEDRNVLLDVKARSDEDDTEQVVSKTIMKPEFIATTPPSLSNYGNNIMNNRANTRYQHLHPDAIQRECLHNPATLNMIHDKPVDFNDAIYDRSNLGNTYFLPAVKNNEPYPQPLHDAEQPVEIMQHQNNDFIYSDLFSNAYPYSHTLSRSTLQEPLGNAGTTVLSKLIDASEHSNIGDKILKYNRRFLNAYEPKIPLRPYFDTFRYFNRFRR